MVTRTSSKNSKVTVPPNVIKRELNSKLAVWFGPSSLALLVLSGQIKQSPALSWIPLDLTVLSAIMVVSGIVICLFSRNQSGVALGVVWPFIIWVFFIPAALFTRADDYGLKILTLFTVSFLLAVAPFYLLRVSEQRKIFVASFAVISLLVTAYSVFVEQTFDSQYSDRLIIAGADSIGSARVAFGATIVFAIAAFLTRKRNLRHIFSVVAALLSAYLGVSTGSRGPLIAVILSLILVISFAPIFRSARAKSLIMLVTIAALFVPFLFLNAADGSRRIVTLFTGVEDTSTQIREILWINAIDMIRRNPVTGDGWGVYQEKFGTYPHNLILELGTAVGTIVTLIFVVILLYSCFISIRNASTPWDAMMLGLFVFSLVTAMVSNDFNDNRLLFVCMFAPWAVLPISDSKPDLR